MAQRVLFGAFGLSSGTMPLPWPTNTPGPTVTDDLLPMMTLGCGDRLDRVPSGQMIASPDSKPRRPSSQLTLAPSRVQACAVADPGQPTPIADIRIKNASARSIVMSPPQVRLSPSSIVVSGRFSVQRIVMRESGIDQNVKLSRLFNRLWKYTRLRPPSLAKILLPLQDRASGEMAEWLKAHAWKACVRETVPWVRIPLSPPSGCSPVSVVVRPYLLTIN